MSATTLPYTGAEFLIEKTVASGLIYLNSHAVDFKTPALRHYLDTYISRLGRRFGRGAGQADEAALGFDRYEFGGRHELYEINYAGSHEEIRRYALFGALASGEADSWKNFAQSCLDEYDLNGWTVPDLINPGDVSVLNRKG